MYNIKNKIKSVIIADTSTLIDFCNIKNGLSLLNSCFDKIYIPFGVYEEVSDKHQRQKLDDNKNFIEVLKNYSQNEQNEIQKILDVGLDKGESEAIGLIESSERFKKENCELLIQDDSAIQFCQLIKIDTIGSLGIVIYAFENNIIKDKEIAFDFIDYIKETNPYIKNNNKLIDYAKLLVEKSNNNKDLILQSEKAEKNNSAFEEGKIMADKDYTMISGFILPKEEMKVETLAKKDGSGDFKACNFSFMLGGKATGDENVLVNVKTTSDKLIERIEKGEIRAGNSIALSGVWNSYEKDDKKYVSFVANNNSVLTLQANEVRSIKEGQKVAISGAVVKMGTYKIKIDGKDLKGYSVNLIVDGKAKNDKGEYTESTYINMKTQNQAQVNIIEKFFKAGKRVMVEGEVKKATFKDKTGKEKEMLYVSTDEGHINLMSSANYIKAIVNGEDRDKSKSASNESVQNEKEDKSIK